MIDCQTEQPAAIRQELHIRQHVLHAEEPTENFGTDSAPTPHDFFDASLAACKTLTAHWYAKKNGIPLERVESHVERDASQERAGVYKLTVRLDFHGQLTEEQRARLYAVVAKCPLHKLMTTTDVQIETVPLGPASG